MHDSEVPANRLEHDAFADDTWILSLTEYVKGLVLSHKKPVVGVCFGHQILARALGARVGRGEGWEVSVDEITLTEEGKKVFGKDTLVSIFFHVLYFVIRDTNIRSTYTKCTGISSSRHPKAALISAIASPVLYRAYTCLTG